MSYSKHVDKYPQEFQLLIIQAAVQPVEVPCADEKEAKRLQGRLYAFLGAVSAAVKEDPSEEMRELAKFARKIQIRTTGSLLTVRPMDQDEDALLLRGILAGPGKAAAAALAPQAVPGQVLVPMNPDHLPPWLAALAQKRAAGE